MAKAPSTAPTASPSRRAQHKLHTQRALQQAALDLFSDQGYDTTTTDEIAERAGVSPRTFFRYFPTKDAVLYVGEYGWFEEFATQFLAQPEGLSDLEAARATLVALAPGLAKIRRALMLYERAVASSMTLRGVVHDRQLEDVSTMAKAMATRRGLPKPDEGCTLLATVVLPTYRRALTRWLAGPASADPAEIVGEELDLLIGEVVGRSDGRAPKRR